MSQVRRLATVTLAALMAAGPALPAQSPAVFRASVTAVGGEAVSGLGIRLVNLDDGRVVAASTDASGRLSTELEPGTYVLDTAGSGRTLLGGQRVVSLASGQVYTAALSLGAPGAAPGSGLTVNHDPLGCLLADSFSQVEAQVLPADRPVQVRVVFRTPPANESLYVDMAPVTDGVYRGTLPKFTAANSPVTYWIEASAADGGKARTAEVSASVVSGRGGCARMATVVPAGPAAGLHVGAAAAASGGVLGLSSTTALLVGGVVAVGVATAVIVASAIR